MAEDLEVAADGAVVVDVVEVGEDLVDRAGFRLPHLRFRHDEAIDRASDGDEQQAEVDEDGDTERDVVALSEACAVEVDGLRLLRSLHRLHCLSLLVAQLLW